MVIDMENIKYTPIVDLMDLDYEEAVKVIQGFGEGCKGIPVYISVSICDYEHSYPVKGNYIVQLYGYYLDDLLVREDKIADVFNTSPTPKQDIITDYLNPFSQEQLDEMPNSIENLFFTCKEDKLISIGISAEDTPPLTFKKHLLTTLDSYEKFHVS